MKTYYKHHQPNAMRKTLGAKRFFLLPFRLLRIPFSILFTLTSYLIPHRLMRRLSSTQRLFINMVIVTIILIFGVFIYTSFINPEQTKAAWFNTSWSYRQAANITNGSGSNLTDFQISMSLDTATLITAGKMQSDCRDLRVTDQNGKMLPHWIETGAKGCNTATTNIWIKVPTLPTAGNTIYLYYGNNAASSIANGDKVFEFFDDFSGNSLDTTKWTVGTIGATSGTNFSISGGLLSGGNSNRTLTSVKSFTGNYTAESRTYTTTSPVNGFTPIGFWSSTANGWAILDHNATSYYRNDGTWVNFAYNGNTQWTRNTAKVVGTTGTYARVGETSGSSTNTGTNSGISGENIRLSARSDNSATNQDYAADWDWILVKKAVTTEPTVSFSTEEQSPAPIGYWSMDEGSGSTVNDLTPNHNNGTISGATWKPASECKVGQCLYFDGTNDQVTFGNINTTASVSGNLTISFWMKPTNIAKGRQNPISKSYTREFQFTQETNTSLSYYHGNGTTYTSVSSPATLKQNEWQQIVLTRDTATRTIKYYINGRLVQTQTYTATYDPVAGTNAFIIGNGYAGYYQGYLDEIIIYSTVKSANEIKSIFSAGDAGTTAVKGTSTSIGTNSQASLSNGLVAYWKMDESSWNGTSGEVIDSSGSDNHGTAVLGTEATPSAKFGDAGYFAGNDEAISVADSASLDVGDTLTIAAWIKRNAISINQYIMQKGSGPYAIGFNASNQLYLDKPGTGNIFTSTTAYTDTTSYHHIVFVKNGSTLSVYVDGTQIAGTFSNQTLIDNSSALYLGSNSGNTSSRFTGNMDEVRIYKRALSPNEVSQLYNYAPGPISYWNFEGSGTTLNDVSASSSANTGTWHGTGLHWGQGKYGKGGTFNGTDDYVSVPATAAIDSIPSGGSITYTAWLKTSDQNTTATYPNIMGIRNGATSIYNLRLYQGKIQLEVYASGTNNTISSTNTVVDGNWHFVAGVKDGNNAYLYVDGVKVASTSNSWTEISQSGTFYIGTRSLSSYFNGSLDEVKIYNYARTPGQIVSDMNGGHPLGGSPVGSQVGYYKFDEGYGTTTHNIGNGGSALNGVISGATWSRDGKFDNALQFDGSSSNVTITDNAALDLTTAWTISGWFNPAETVLTGSDRQVLISKWQTSSGLLINYYLYIRTNGKVEAAVANGSTAKVATGTTVLSPNHWYYLAATFDGATGNLLLYVNGVLEATTATGYTTAYANTGNVRLGQYDFAWSAYRDEYKGLMDEIKIYTAALSPSEIKIDYNQNSALSLGAISNTSGLAGGSIASSSASAAYCIPGDTTTCTPPVGEWTFNEGRGTTANDTSGNGYTGTVTNATWTQGKKGNSLKFSGSNQYVSVTDTSGLQITSNITVSLWVKPTALNNQAVNYPVSKGSGAGVGNGWAFGITGTWATCPSNQFYLYTNNGQICSGSGNTIPLNTWSHIAFTNDGTTTRLYLNGKLVNSGAQTIETNSGNNLNFGRRSDGNWYFNGAIDHIQIFNYARSASQVAWDYNNGKPVASYDFDECQGTTLHDLMFGRDGTITIGATGTQTSVGTCQTASTAWGNGATGKFNSSLNFDGTDDYFTISQPSITTSPNAFTVTGYIKPTTQDAFFLTPNSNGVDQWIGYDVDAQRLWVSVATLADTNQSSYYSTANSVPTNTWTHFAVSINNRDVKIYINGKLNYSVTHGFDIGGWTNTWYVGQRGNSTFWYAGQMDDLQIFPYPLTQAQIQNVMNQSGAVRFGPSTGTP